MSVGVNSAVAENSRSSSRLDHGYEQSGTISLSRAEIARLAETGTRCLIISLPDGYRRFGEADEAVIVETETSRRSRHRVFNALFAGTCIGASTGLSVACTFMIMTQKAPVSVATLIEKAMTLFA